MEGIDMILCYLWYLVCSVLRIKRKKTWRRCQRVADLTGKLVLVIIFRQLKQRCCYTLGYKEKVNVSTLDFLCVLSRNPLVFIMLMAHSI
jgi:hypothetical protein